MGSGAACRLRGGRSTRPALARRVKANGDLCYMPELLRVKANLLLSMSASDEVHTCLLQALDTIRNMGARGWELRAATDLARFLAAEGRISDAGALLQPILEKLDEALDTEDLKIAGGVLR